MVVVTLSAPANYRKLLGKLPDHVNFSDRVTANSMFVHLFTTKPGELEKKLSILRKKIADAGTVWVSWPKKSSGVSTDITEDVIRAVALPIGFVDVKVCAVDETWSGLKLMIRRENRQSTK
jgi:ABC-type Na+ transport system ATPase subunit NatA